MYSSGAQRGGREILLGVANNFTPNETVIYYEHYFIVNIIVLHNVGRKGRRSYYQNK